VNTKQSDRLRKTLTTRRQELQATLSRIQQELRASTTPHADAADQAVASYDKNALHQQAELANSQMRLLDDALRRIDAGDYGECVMCGKEISIARLEAIPWARYCVECQEFQEGTKV
jgi:RNA polymerase-binding transcription factor